MKILLTVLFLSICGVANATESRLSDGSVQFAYGQVGSTLAWNSSDYDSMVSQCVGSCETQLFTPTSLEVNISTNVYKFENYSDYESCFTKEGTKRKIMEVIVVVPEFWSNMRMMGYPHNPKIDWLVSYYLSLP